MCVQSQLPQVEPSQLRVKGMSSSFDPEFSVELLRI